MTTETQDARESQAFTQAFELNDLIHDCATTMEKLGLDNPANRGKLAQLRVQLKHIILDVVRRFMRPGDKDALEKLFASVAKTISETRIEVGKRRDVDPVRAKHLLDDLEALEGLASDYQRAIFGEKARG